ncbi:MAG TPA: DUF2207 domain-containing protein [Patescibacteria group bacterium]|nr:DUF2207 domain-containing protein [Patescibacteria group bacterium]
MKKFLSFCIVVGLVLFFVPFVHAEQINNFAADITINTDGTIDVVETITYDFGEVSRHGIYRDIPYIKTNNAGKKFKLNITILSIEDENRKRYPYDQTQSGENIHLKIGDPNKTITGVHTYIIRYRVSGAVTYFSDHDELYWNVTGNDWTVGAQSASATVRFPKEIKQSQLKAICYTGTKDNREMSCSVNLKGGIVVFETDRFLSVGEGFTIVVSFPKGLVSVLEPAAYTTFWQTLFGRFVVFLMFLLATFWYIIYPIFIVYKWYKHGRDPSPAQGQPGEVRAWFDPPKNKNGRFLTPEETGTLIDEMAQMREICGMIVYLAQKGYMKIEEREKGDFYFVKSKDFSHDKNLLLWERSFLNDLFERQEVFSIKDSKKEDLYKTVEDAKKGIYEGLVAEGFFPHNPARIRNFYVGIGVLAMMTFNWFLAAAAFIFGRNLVRKTQEGVLGAQVAKSLRNFLVSQERQLEFQAKNQLMFERLLPYAIVFGVEKIWAARFKDVSIQPSDWYQGYSGAVFNSILLTNGLNSSFSSLRVAATPRSSSSGFGSGFSGGSSGGGGGGGGGGGW